MNSQQQSWEEAYSLHLWSSEILSLQVLRGCALYPLSGASRIPEHVDKAPGCAVVWALL